MRFLFKFGAPATASFLVVSVAIFGRKEGAGRPLGYFGGCIGAGEPVDALFICRASLPIASQPAANLSSGHRSCTRPPSRFPPHQAAAEAQVRARRTSAILSCSARYSPINQRALLAFAWPQICLSWEARGAQQPTSFSFTR